MAECFLVKQFALLTFHGRVANHACRTADKSNRLVTGTLEVFKHHDTDKMPYMQAVGSRVYAQICCCHLFFELFLGAGHHLVNHAAPGEFIYKIHR